MKKQLLMGAFLLGSFLTANAQLSESFEGTDIPAGWTVINGGDTNTWTVADLTGSELTAQDGSSIATIQYSATAHDDYLITPAITVTDGVSNIFSFFGRSRDPQYPEVISVLLSTTTTDESAFTETLIAEVAPESGANFYNYNVDLSAYEGQTVYIAFYSSTTDQFVFDIDLVESLGEVPCVAPSGFAFIDPQPTTTSVNIGWSDAGAEYEFEYGLLGFDQGTGTPLTLTESQVSLTELTASTDYAFYVRTSCGGDSYSDWVGPIAFNTVFEAATPTYTYGFETPSLGGWALLNAGEGASWTTMLAAEGFTPQEGDVAMAAGAFGTESDAWLFTRGIELASNETATLTYYVKKRIGAGAGNVNNLGVFVGTDRTVEAQSTNLVATAEVTNEDWVMEQVQFAAPAAGVYYFSFNYTAPAHAQTNFGWAVIDNVEVTAVASVDQVSASQLSVFPNPANNVVNIANASNNLVNAIEVVDLNGRTVKSIKFDGVSEAQINISELSSGVYMMNIATDNSSVTKKIVKN